MIMNCLEESVLVLCNFAPDFVCFGRGVHFTFCFGQPYWYRDCSLASHTGIVTAVWPTILVS
jgi:hypothetical protein